MSVKNTLRWIVIECRAMFTPAQAGRRARASRIAALIVAGLCLPAAERAFGQEYVEEFDRAVLAVSEQVRAGHEPPALSWPVQPAIPELPPALAGEAARQFLMRQVREHVRPSGRVTPADESFKHAISITRQGVALGFLAVDPTVRETQLVAALLRGGAIWEPWRAGLVLGASRQAELLSDLEPVLRQNSKGWAGGQTALAIGLLGNPRGAEAIERFMRERFGTQEFQLGIDALLQLGTAAGAQQAVKAAAWRLFREHPQGTETQDGMTVQLDHPYRVRMFQSVALETLWRIGALTDPQEARAAIAAFESVGDLPWNERAYVLKIIGSGRVALPAAEIETRIAAGLADNDARVRQAALAAAAESGLSRSMVDRFVDALADDDEQVRTTALDALQRLGERTYAFNPQKPAALQHESLTAWRNWAKQQRDVTGRPRR